MLWLLLLLILLLSLFFSHSFICTHLSLRFLPLPPLQQFFFSLSYIHTYKLWRRCFSCRISLLWGETNWAQASHRGCAIKVIKPTFRGRWYEDELRVGWGRGEELKKDRDKNNRDRKDIYIDKGVCYSREKQDCTSAIKHWAWREIKQKI